MNTEAILVLHVDDDPEFLELTAASLESVDDGIRTETARSASEGLDRLAEGDVDCVLSDYQMPETDGIEFLEAVRADHPDLPFVLFTGEGSEEVASDAISAGATDYFRKRTTAEQYDLLANRVRNVVDRYRTRNRADRIEEEHQLVAELATDVFYAVDLRTNRLEMSDGVRTFGYDPDDVGTDNSWWLERVHPDDRDRIRALAVESTEPTPEGFESFSGDRGRVESEYRWRRADGSFATVVGTGITVFDGAEAIKQVGTMRDVTERRQRDRERERARRRMEFALTATDAIVWSWNVETDEATFYPSAETLYGTDVNSWEEFVELVHPDDREDVSDSMQRALETGEQKEEEIRIVRDGEVRWIAAPGQPILDDDGPDRMIGVARDITERKESERALQRQNEQLDQFTSMVSHDLRGPLSVATGRLELARDDVDSSHLDDVADALSRMETLLDDLLTLAREGEQAVAIEAVDLAPHVEDCWDRVAPAGAALRVETDARIRADPSRLTQLLDNLFRNAVEHGSTSPQRAGDAVEHGSTSAREAVTVRVGDLDGEGFYVADDGPGVPPEERDRVFDASYSTEDDGTGFGLTIVRNIAGSHDWTVGVVESADGGARFEIRGVEPADG